MKSYAKLRTYIFLFHSMLIGIVVLGGSGIDMGREFLDIFENWAESYDDSLKQNKEYEDVFSYYDNILSEVANRSFGHVVEFGTGTGNLTSLLVERGLIVTGIEPSVSMRQRALEKLGDLVTIIDGDFLNFDINFKPDTITSTYAFHHLTDEEKNDAIKLYSTIISNGGKIVFADTIFESNEAYHSAIQKAEDLGYANLVADLKREYYTTIPILKSILVSNGFSVAFKKMNDFVWIVEAVKQ